MAAQGIKEEIFKIYNLPPGAEGFDVDLIKEHNEIKRKILAGHEDQLTSKELDFMIANSLPNYYVEFEEVRYLLPLIFNFLKSQGRHRILGDDHLLHRIIQYKDSWDETEKAQISAFLEWYMADSFKDGDFLDGRRIIHTINHWFPDCRTRIERLFQSNDKDTKFSLIQLFEVFVKSDKSIREFFINHLFTDTPYFSISNEAETVLRNYFNRDYIKQYILSNLYVLEDRWDRNLIRQLKEETEAL